MGGSRASGVIRGARRHAVPSMRLPSRRVLTSAALLTAFPAAGALHAGAATPRTVVLKNIAFAPAKLAIRKGQTVTWSWKDGDTQHNLHAVGRLRFKGTGARASGTYRVTFRKRGTYRYECTLHPGMTGTVVVQ